MTKSAFALPAVFSLLAVVGCSGSRPPEPLAVAQPDKEPLYMAEGCRPVAPPSAIAAEASAQRFTPVGHPPHRYEGASSMAAALPPLVVGRGQCTPGNRPIETKTRVVVLPPRPRPRPTAGASVADFALGKPGSPAKRKADAAGIAAGVAAATAAPAAEKKGVRRPSPVATAAPPPAAPAPANAAAPAPAAAPEPAAQASPPPATAGADYAHHAEKEAPAAEAIATEPAPCPEVPAPSTSPPAPTDAYTDWGGATYLSNDDTMSLSSAQRIIYAIDHFLPLPPEHIRPHELLNYFTFDTAPVRPDDDFSVLPTLAPMEKEGVYSLALSVKGRPLDRASRRNVALTILVDRSGSMKEEGRMGYVKRGLHRMTGELKPGDILHLLSFNTTVCVTLQNFVVGRDPMSVLDRAIDGITPQGNTDLYAGLTRAYELADATYQPRYSNRVLLVTDALTNTGQVDPDIMALVARHYDQRRVRLSGIGVGRTFNDRLLDRLTEKGKGAYVFLGSEAEVDALFGTHFVSLVETVALDTHFLLRLPPSLRLDVFYGEESSTVKEEVQPIHFFASSAQLFLGDVMAKQGKLRSDDDVLLRIEYAQPETGAPQVEEYAFHVGSIDQGGRNAKKGRLVVTFADALAWMAARSPERRGTTPRSWEDDGAFWECDRRRGELRRLATGLDEDPEVRRVVGLWETYCTRFAPARSSPPAPGGWPAAR
jgi:Ca-activated chloride channel homolog